MGAEAAIERRAFIKAASNVAAGVLLGGLASPWIARAAAPFRLPPLPYPENALAPAISANTIGFHYGKHHRAYVDNLNKQVVEMPDLVSLSLIEIVQKTAGNAEQKSIFNNAAQAWNHEFYWNSLTPKGGAAPTGVLKDRIDADFGGVAHLKDALRKVSVAQFGSGWGWLVEEDSKLRVVSTSNAARRLCTARSRCSQSTFGSTPITSTIRTDGPTTSTRCWTASSTGTSHRKIWSALSRPGGTLHQNTYAGAQAAHRALALRRDRGAVNRRDQDGDCGRTFVAVVQQ